MAIAEALIERDELVAEEIEQLIKEADAKRVAKKVITEFEAVLGNGNGHSNGKNGHALVDGRSNGSGALSEGPHVNPVPSSSSDGGGTISMQVPPTQEGPLFFSGG